MTTNIPDQEMSDMDKVMRLTELRNRHMLSMPNIMPGKASESVLEEFKRIYAGYDELIKAGPPEFEFYTMDEVRANMADVLDMIARAYDSMRLEEEAIRYYEKAASAFDEIGQADNANRSRENIAKIRASIGGSFDEELQRLRTKLEGQTDGTLEYFTTLVDVGELYMKGGDDYTAKDTLEKAQLGLEKAGYPDPSGHPSMDLITSISNEVMSGDLSNLGKFEELVLVRGLYQRIYQSLAQIYQDAVDLLDNEEELEKAKVFQEKFERFSAEEVTQEDLAKLLAAFGGKNP
jgi:tetratricopeptide (TPR) repeat protein